MSERPRFLFSDSGLGKLIFLPVLAVLLGLVMFFQPRNEETIWVNLFAAGFVVGAIFGLYELAGWACGWILSNTPLSAERRLLRATRNAQRTIELNTSMGLFRAGGAFVLFGSYAATQMVVWIVFVAVAMGSGGEFSTERLQPIVVPCMLLSVIGAAGITALVFRYYAHVDNAPGVTLLSAVGFRSTSFRFYGLAAFVGLVIGIGTLALSWNVPLPEGYELDIVQQAAQTPGLAQAVWIFVAMMLAPPIEETLFRGAMLEGMRRSWGIWVAGSVTTVLFLCMHMPQVFLYWPAGVGLTIGAVTTLLLRLRSDSLGPPIIVHFCYNSVMAVAVLWSGTP